MQAIFFLCFTTVIALASAQSTQLELSLDQFPFACARACLPYVLRIIRFFLPLLVAELQPEYTRTWDAVIPF